MWQTVQTWTMLARRSCQPTAAIFSRPSLASETSGRMETGGRLFQLIRRPTSWVTGTSSPSAVRTADMWQVAQVGAAV